MREFLLSQKWWLLGSVFAGLSMFCAAKQGMDDYAADHVWEEADRVNASAAAITEQELPKAE
jgi:hypothetical protein